MDMGVKPVFKLTTADGRTIRTTGNHPYLVKGQGSRVKEDREMIARQRLEKLEKEFALAKGEFSAEREFAEPKYLRETRNEKGRKGTFLFFNT